MATPERALVGRVRRWLGLDMAAGHDALPDLIEEARAATEDAWEAVNLSRCRRGEAPLRPPTWDEVLQPRKGIDCGP